MSEFKTPEPPKGSRSVKKTEQDAKSPPQFMIPPSPCMKQLGYGTGVNVYLLERFSPLRGCYKSPWAVKKINSKVVTTVEYGKRLSFEASVLKDLDHPNIIGYRSYSNLKEGSPCLMMESGEKSLLQIIEERQAHDSGPLPVEHILKVARDVAGALQYLHDEKRLLHGDLKSANVLIKGHFDIAKLCDFGVALNLDKEGNAYEDEEYVGTECWSAAEVINFGNISHKTDMFSFGLIMWEMLALSAPHIDKLHFDELEEDTSNPEAMDKNMIAQGKAEDEYLKSLGTRPGLPDVVLGKDYLPVLEIFYACTETDPDCRPSAKQVLKALSILKEIQMEVDQVKEK